MQKLKKKLIQERHGVKVGDRPFSLKNDIKAAFEHRGLPVLNYQCVLPNWISLTVDGSAFPAYRVGVLAVAACSLAVEVRHVLHSVMAVIALSWRLMTERQSRVNQRPRYFDFVGAQSVRMEVNSKACFSLTHW